MGAAPLEGELEEFWSHLGYVVVQGYGLTETAPVVTVNHPFKPRRGTVGAPIPAVGIGLFTMSGGRVHDTGHALP